MKNLRILRFMLLSLSLIIGEGTAHGVMPFHTSARSVGMGGAFTAMAFESSALYWNPALLGDIGKKDLTGTFTRDAFDTTYSFAAYAQPFSDWGGIAGGWARAANRFEKTDAGGNQLGFDDISSDVFMAGFGFYRAWPVSLGATVKYVDEHIGSFSLSGTGIDGGILFEAQPFRFSLVWENMLSAGLTGKSVSGQGVDEQMPSDMRLGIALFGQNACRIEPAPSSGPGSVHIKYALATDVLIPLDNRKKLSFSPGFEGWFDNTVAFRAGMRELRDYTLGLSLQMRGLRFDYAFVGSSTIENSHVFSTSFFF